jgi:hypothetical protein
VHKTSIKDERIFVPCEAASSPYRLANRELAVALPMNPASITDQLRLAQSVSSDFQTAWDPLECRLDVELMISEITAIPQVVFITTLLRSKRLAGVEWSDLLPPQQPVDVDSGTAFRLQ